MDLKQCRALRRLIRSSGKGHPCRYAAGGPTVFHHCVLQWNSSHPYRLLFRLPNEMLHLCHQSAILRSIERRTFVALVCIMCLLDFWHRAPLFQLWEAGEPLQRLHQEVIARLSFLWIFFFQGAWDYFHCDFSFFFFHLTRLLLLTNRQADAFLCIFFWMSFDDNVFVGFSIRPVQPQHPSSKVALPHNRPEAEILG